MTISSIKKQNLIDGLVSQLEQNSNLKTKQWFDNYLKGAIEYRGVKTPQVIKLVKDWHQENQLRNYTVQEQLTLCIDLIASSFAEDKFAGIIYIQRFLISEINYQELLAECDIMFKQNYFFDWSTTDWFCIRVLDPIIINYGLDAATIIANWRQSENFWQRRAAIVSFRHASCDRQYHALIKLIIDDLVQENQRFIQTGIGWVLADMSKSYPTEVEALFRQYIHFLAKEVIDRHAKHLLCYQELKQLKRQL